MRACTCLGLSLTIVFIFAIQFPGPVEAVAVQLLDDGTVKNHALTDLDDAAKHEMQAHAGMELNVGRRGGGALMTSGSFAMMSSNRAGNSEDEEEEDGEETEQLAEPEGRTSNKMFRLTALKSKEQNYKKISKQLLEEVKSAEEDTMGETVSVGMHDSAGPVAKAVAAATNATNAASEVLPKGKWLGAFNSSHVDAHPRDDGSQTPSNAHCASAVSPGNNKCCTSCKQGYVFAMKFHNNRTGRCLHAEPVAQIVCSKLGSDSASAVVEAKDVVCTKVIESRQALRIGPGQDDLKLGIQPLTGLRKEAYKSSKIHNYNGLDNNWVVARCRVRKETVCQKSQCQVRKEIKCISVCKMTRWATPPTYIAASCDEALCSGDLASMACRQATMME